MMSSVLSHPLRPAEDLSLYVKSAAEYLTEAFASGRVLDVAVALFDIQHNGGGDVRRFELGYNLRLDEIVDILERANLRLVAVPAIPPAE